MVSDIRVVGGAAAAVASALASGPPARLEEQGNRVAARTQQAEKAGDVEGGRVGGNEVRRTEYAVAQSERDARNQLAVETRDKTERLARVEEGLAAMKEGLDAVVKRYPPFPKDNPERIDLINQVNGLKKQIEALAVPAEVSAGQDAAATKELAPDATPGLAELIGLEDFPGDLVTDEELATILATVESSQAKVAEAREKMWADIQAFVESEDDKQVDARSSESRNALAEGQLPITQAKEVLAKLL